MNYMIEAVKQFRFDVRDVVKQYHGPTFVYWMQAFWYCLRYGASPNDYIRYEFYLKNGRGVNEYITALRHSRELVPGFNNARGGELKENKYETNCKLRAYISRGWIKVDRDSDIDEIVRFIESHDAVMVKPLDLNGGRGIKKYVSSEIPDVRALVEELRKGEFLIEEVVKQHEDMNAFNPYSVNTLRIYTLCDKNGGVAIVDTFVRMATKEIAVDNFHSGGCAAEIDRETGIVISPAGDYDRHYYIMSPVTQKCIPGRVIPSWEEAKAMCVEIAKELYKEEKRYVAFDIAILQNGQPELIEVNWLGDPVIRQQNGCRPHGKYWEMKKFL